MLLRKKQLYLGKKKKGKKIRKKLFLAEVKRARCLLPGTGASLRGAEAAPTALEGAGRARRARPASSAPASPGCCIPHSCILHPCISCLCIRGPCVRPLSSPFAASLFPASPAPASAPPVIRRCGSCAAPAPRPRSAGRAPAGLHGGARGLRRRRGRHGGGFRRLREPAVQRGQALLPEGAGDLPGDPGGPHALQG